LEGYFSDKTRIIRLRNGLALKTSNRDDISSFSVIFIKDEYGKTFGTRNTGLTIVDIGANKGYFSILAAKNNLNKIFSYEPISSTYKALEENIALNKLQNIKSFKIGVGGENGTKEFYFSEDKSIVSSSVFKTGNKVEKIQCISLQDVFTSNNITSIDVLKMDCEGSEFEIIYKADKDTLAKIKSLRMEYHDHNTDKTGLNNIDALIKYLKNNNFELIKKESSNPTLGIAWFKNKNARDCN
jgi:FkbM family methyltransferase